MWGDAVLKNNLLNKIIQIYDQFNCQKLNIKYRKFILGVHKMSSSQAVLGELGILGVHKMSSSQARLGELGRFPLFIDIIINLFKYYKRINDMEQDSLLYQVLNECKTLHQSGKIFWYSNLTNILNCFNIDKDTSELSNLKSELKKQYEEFWKISIKRTSKLDTC